MRTSIHWHVALGVVLLTSSLGRAQDAMPGPRPVDDLPADFEMGDSSSEITPEPRHELSSWMTGKRCNCCGPLGGFGPIDPEIYIRTGPNLITGGRGVRERLHDGWFIVGGGRSLFFNENYDRAWVLDLSVGNIKNTADSTQTFNFLNQNVGLISMSRTMFNYSLGREHYLFGPAHFFGRHWRYGYDLGGRWSTVSLILNNPGQLTGYEREGGTYVGIFGALHTDLEFPWRTALIQFGFRAEWGYNWSSLVPGGFLQLQEVNLLGTAGVRF